MKSIKTKRLLLIFCSMLFFVACGSEEEIDEPTGATFSENFVQVYIMPTTLKVFHYNENFIGVSFKGEEIKSNNSSEFRRLSQRYNDTSYNKNLIPGTNISVGEEYFTINITCDKEIEGVPAGGYWNSFVKLCGTSPYDFIKSGYKTYTNNFPSVFERLPLNIQHGQSPIYKYVGEITKNDLILLNETFFLIIENDLPSGEYTLTITVSNNEKNISNTVKYVVK